MTRHRLAAIACALTLPVSASAADTCTIRGDTHDTNGKPIVGAAVIVQPAVAQPIETADDGSFVVSNLRPGRYTVVIVGSGLRPWAAREFRVNRAETARLHAVMDVETKPAVVEFDEPTESELEGFGDVLTATGEPPLCSPSRVQPGVEAYRFVWLRSFHHPVIVELRFNSPSDVVSIYKETEGAGGYEIGPLSRKEVRSVSKDFLDDIADPEMAAGALEMLREEGFEEFWTLPFRVDVLDGMIGMDGATWTIEGVKDSRCHVVTRWSPSDHDPVRALGLRLLGFTKEKLLFDEVY